MGFKFFQTYYYFSSDCMKTLIVGLRHHFIYKQVSKYNYFTNPNISGSQDSISYVAEIKAPEFQRRRGLQRMRWLDDITDSMDMSLSKLREIVKREAWHAVVRGVTKTQTLLSNWTTTNKSSLLYHEILLQTLAIPWGSCPPCGGSTLFLL